MDLELYLGEDLAIPMVDFSEEDLEEERNAEFGITISDDPRLFEVTTPEPTETPENFNNNPSP